MEKELQKRSGDRCEMCGATENLSVFYVPNSPDYTIDAHIYTCEICKTQMEDPSQIDPHHWHSLNDSIWSPVPAVQVMSWRMLQHLKTESWSQNLLDMMYLDEDLKSWAEAGLSEKSDSQVVHRDANGNVLNAGDTVVLIKDLKVKGSSMIAKQGTAVRRISLDQENEKFIEGRVDGQHIVIITDFVKKI